MFPLTYIHVYIGETLELAILIMHISKSDSNFDFNAATMLVYIHNKRLRQIFEAGAISLCRNINNLSGFFNRSIDIGLIFDFWFNNN